MHVDIQASLRFSLKGDRRGFVTEHLSLAPDSEKLVETAGSNQNTAWVKKSGLGEDQPIEAHLMAILMMLDRDPAAVKSVIKAGARMDVFIGVFLRDLQGGFSISSETMRRLSSYGAEIGFDCYGLV